LEEASVVTSTGEGFPYSLDANGDLYRRDPASLYAGGLAKLSGDSLAPVTSWAYPRGVDGGGGFTNVEAAAGQFTIDVGVGGGIFGALAYTTVSRGTSYITSTPWVNGTHAFVCAGKPGSNKGFWIETPGSAATQTLTLRQASCGALVAFSTIGTIAPADIDATWTEINCNGVCCDQTDGKLLAIVYTDESVTNTCYLVKIDPSDGSVVWVSALPNPGASSIPGGKQFSQSSILNQKVAILSGGPTTVTIVDTSDGSSTSYTSGLAGVTPHGVQCYSDTLGGLVVNLSFLETAGSPARLNATPSSYAGWFVLYVDNPIAPPAQPGTPDGPATSRKRAWSFVLDGHTFYVLDLGAEGTWLYDNTTKTWSNWYTLAYVQWDVACGCMWGQRVVGCDLATTDVWEVAATNLTDNGLYDIPHVVTGGIDARSRDRFGCDGLLLSASLGDLGNSSGSIMNMRFSDDNGNTWSDYFPIAMEQDDFTTELRWRSLGSFGAPGRIFEFSDTGGPRSIEGCDAFLNGFDDEQPAQQVQS
jgi:hypothetical protein